MKSCTRRRLVPLALAATGLCLCALQGCEKGEEAASKPAAEAAAVPSSSPESYMKDPTFRKAVEEKRKELQAIVSERKPLAERMQELVREHGEDLAALQKIPEWNELHKKVVALNARYEEVRQRQLRIVRGRLTSSGETEKASK